MNGRYEQGCKENARVLMFAPPPPVKLVSEEKPVPAYDQGWMRVRKDLKERQRESLLARFVRWFRGTRSRSEFKKDLGAGLCLVALAHIALFTLLALFGAGCGATSIQTTAVQMESADQATLRGLVQVAQMGTDCTEQNRLLKKVISDMFVSADVPTPDQIEVTPLSGSSLCGLAQGMANELGTPEYGARNIARAEVKLYWSLLYESQLKRAHRVLLSMAPLRTNPRHNNRK